MAKVSLDNFTEAHRLYLEKLQKAYEVIWIMASSFEVINPDWPDYKKAVEEFNQVQEDIFKLKDVWESARQLKEES